MVHVLGNEMAGRDVGKGGQECQRRGRNEGEGGGEAWSMSPVIPSLYHHVVRTPHGGVDQQYSSWDM